VSGRSQVWRSTDSGATWHPSSAGLEGAGHHNDIGIDPADGSLFFGTVDWSLIRSDPGRQTFTLHSVPVDGPDIRALCFAFSAQQFLLGAGCKFLSVGNVGGVCRSTDRGATWTVATGLPSTDNRVVGIASAPSDPDIAYAAVTHTGVFISTNGGKSFTAMPVHGLADHTTLFPQSFTKVPIAVHPTDPNTVYLLDHVNGLYAYSPTAGAWTNVSAGVGTGGNPVNANARYQGFALDPLQPSRLYVATSAGLYRWVEAKSSWVKADIPQTEGFGPVAVDPGTGWVFAATALPVEASLLTDQLGIYVSKDGGASWEAAYVDGRFALDINVLVIDPTAPNTVWAGSAGCLFSLSPAVV
jgi:photosystem II stability/assembly factor-like uncharacterized protein